MNHEKSGTECRAPSNERHFSSKYSSVPSPSRGDWPGRASAIGLTKRVYHGFFARIAAAVLVKNERLVSRLREVSTRSEILKSARLPSAVAKDTPEPIGRSRLGSGWRAGAASATGTSGP